MTVDTTIRYMSAPQGENFTFSLSKPLSELTAAEVQSQEPWAGYYSFAHNQLAEGNLGTGIPENNPNHCFAYSVSQSSGSFPAAWMTTYWCSPANFPDGVYIKTILVYRPLNKGNNTSLTNNMDDVRIVLEVTPDENTSMQKLQASNGNNGPFICVRYNNDQNAENRLTDYYYISPAMVMVVGSTLYLIIQNVGGVTYQAFHCYNTITTQGYSGGYQNFNNVSDHNLAMGWIMPYGSTSSVLTNFVVDSATGTTGSGHISDVDFNGHRGQLNLNVGQSSGYNWSRSTLTIALNDVAEDKDITKMYMAFSGFRFQHDGTWYKPVVEGGIIVGYTDDMSVQSEWDTWTTATGHDVPAGPPLTPVDLVSDEQVTGGIYYGGAFVNCYACTKAELAHLQSWCSGGAAGTAGTNPQPISDAPNMSPMDQIIGLTSYPIEIPVNQVGSDTTFTFTKADNTTINTGWATKTAALTAIKYTSGMLKAEPWEAATNEVPWLDYSCTVECYVPFCGVVGLDPQVVMGNYLRVQMWIDFMTGDCSAYIECNSDGWHPVAYMTGNVGAAEAMSAAAFGQLMGARAAASHATSQAIIGGVKDALTGTINSAVTGYTRGAAGSTIATPRGQSSYLAGAIQSAGGSMGLRAGAIGGAVTSAIDLGVSLTQQQMDNRYNYVIAKNSLGTTIAGSFGSSAAWHFPAKPYIKVSYPTPASNAVSNYGKTYGVPVHKDGTLNKYHGYTICNNVDTSGISTATAEEQSMIKQFLESGVYLP